MGAFICLNCDSRDIKFNEDGWGTCSDCGVNGYQHEKFKLAPGAVIMEGQTGEIDESGQWTTIIDDGHED